MHKTPSETTGLCRSLKLKLINSSAEIGVCPTALSIPAAVDILKESEIQVGAQNIYTKDAGAFTGEISGPMIRDAGAKLVIVGHSERRTYFKEDGVFLHSKIEHAIASGLVPIYCIGETREQREESATSSVLRQQLKETLTGFTTDELSDLVIAYEPVWAIGTGLTATPEQVVEAHQLIRQTLAEIFSEHFAHAVRIQYGGSVNESNAAELMANQEIDGALVGGASLDAEKFATIVRAAAQYC